MQHNTKIRTKQELPSELSSIENALVLVNELKLIETTLEKMSLVDNLQAFSKLLSHLIESCTIIPIYAEYYDNNGYTDKDLIVTIDYTPVEYEDIDISIGYDYNFVFSHQNKFIKLNCCCYYILYNNEKFNISEAEKLFKTLAHTFSAKILKDEDMVTEDEKTINLAIHHAYHIGDQDEAFIKHVGHTLSAIYAGNGYKNVVDYVSPDCSDDELIQLHKYWAEVEKVCKRIGKEQFRKLALQNPYTEHFDDWYIDQAEKSNIKR
jgi:hypothetical protein